MRFDDNTTNDIKQSRRKVILSGIGTIGVGLAGCLSTGSGGNGSGGNGSGGNGSGGNGSGGNGSGGETTVSWTAWDDRDVFHEEAQSFSESNNGIKAKFIHTPGDPHREYHQAMVSKIGSGNVPDLMNLLIPDSVSLFAREDKIVALDQFIENDDEFSLDRYHDIIEEMIRIPPDNNVYCLPNGLNTITLYYNKEMYSEAGIDTPPETWEELKQTLQALKDNGNNLPFYNPFENGVTKMFWQFMFQKGGNVTNEDNSKSTLMSQENLEALQFIKELIDNDLVVNTNNAEPNYSTEAIGDEYAAHIFGGPWHWRTVNHEKDILDKIGIAPLPIPSDGEDACVANTNSIAMASVSDVQDSAWQFQKFLSAGEGIQMLYKQTGATLSPLKDDIDNSYYQDRPKLATHMEVIPDAHQLMWGPKTPEMMTEHIVPQLQAVYLGDKSPEEGLKSAHDGINSLL